MNGWAVGLGGCPADCWLLAAPLPCPTPVPTHCTPLLCAPISTLRPLSPPGLLSSQAAEVFVRCPALGNTRNVMPAIVRLVVEQHALSWQAEPAAEHA